MIDEIIANKLSRTADTDAKSVCTSKKQNCTWISFDFLISWNVDFQYYNQSDRNRVGVTTRGRTKKRTQKVQTVQELLIKQKNKEKR